MVASGADRPELHAAGQRGARWVSHPFATWKTRPTRGRHGLGARLPQGQHAEHNWRRLLDFIGDKGDERIKAAFGEGEVRPRAQINRDDDPADVFAGDQDIRPKVSA